MPNIPIFRANGSRSGSACGGQPAFDPTKPWGLGQQAPLTPEYQKILEESIAEQAKGNQGNWLSGISCLPTGMPAMMTLYRPMEIVVLPETTYIRIDHTHQSHRRIFTDGRDWPKDFLPSFRGYSIGKWIDTDGDGKYDVLEVETRFLKGPRALDPAGMPIHEDNNSIVKERIYFDKADPELLHDEITLIDHAFTRPWTVLKTYRRDGGKASGLARGQLRRRGHDPGRQGNLLPQRRRHDHAHAQGSAAAEPEILPASEAVTLTGHSPAQHRNGQECYQDDFAKRSHRSARTTSAAPPSPRRGSSSSTASRRGRRRAYRAGAAHPC